MHFATARRAFATATAITLLTIPTAFAETATADGDVLTPGIQATVDLGTAEPGQDVGVNVSFRVDCTGTSHVDAGQSVRLSPGSRTIPPGGGYSVGSLTFGLGSGWPADGSPCSPDQAPVVGGPIHVVVTAPPSPGVNYKYVFSWNVSLLPTTATDAGVFETGAPTVTFLLDVVDNTPPSLVLPADLTVEGNTTNGAVADYSVSATDAEDASAPVPTCSPALGEVLPLGPTTVECSVTDEGGLTDSGSFVVTVVDTTPPDLDGLPGTIELTTEDPAGAVASWTGPSANDLVDGNPTVECTESSGSMFPVGTTVVECTASDASGNHRSGSFSVVVAFVDPVDWSARWGEPVATSGSTFVANPGRNIPVKVQIYADGVEQRTGHATLTTATCEGVAVASVAMTWGGGRWNASLDTGALGGPGCYLATAALDGNDAGSFRIDLRGEQTPVKGAKARGKS